MAHLIETLRLRVAEIGSAVIVRQARLDGWEMRSARHLGPGLYDYADEDWRPLDVGDIWARQGWTAFLRRTITIPEEWAGLKVGLELRTGGEGLLVVDGEPRHGIDDNRGYVRLAESAGGGEAFACEVEMKTGGYLEYVAGDVSRPYILSEARLVGVDRDLEAAHYDYLTAIESAAAVEDPLVRDAILFAIRSALADVDFRDRTAAAFRDALLASRDRLRSELEAIDFGRKPGTIFFAGHSHIDVAWLWPLKETMRKVGRTYATVDALMEEFPDYHFVCSQVPLFLYLKEQFPSVYARVKERIAEGRFEPIGGTWVENDTNVVSGESMVRQCLYGKRFFREEFGVDVRVGWLPDVFGYAWSLPQIYRQAGLEYFMTSKVAWNETNRLPHNTFWWEGIDGTRILTHLVHNLQNMYNAHVLPAEMLRQWADYADKLQSPEILCPFGYGDGGGGPTRRMLEYLPRLAAMPGLPAARTGRVHDFFDRMAGDHDQLPVWNGEMYFERHRGTYTTHAANKRDNRRCELLYRDAEMFSVVAAILGRAYPFEELRARWQTILLNQFHDILPGSSIHQVYEDSAVDYAETIEAGLRLRDEAMEYVAGFINTDGDGTPVIVYNSLSWARDAIVEVELPASARRCTVWDPSGRAVPACIEGKTLLFLAERVPSCGYAVYRIVDEISEPVRERLHYADGRATSPFYEITFGDSGGITRLYDILCHREVMPEGALGNHLQVFEDKPVRDEAWDIDLSYQDRAWAFQSDGPPTVIEQNALRLILGQTLRYGSSVIEQRMILYAHDPRIDFVTRVDWQERKTMLKVAFPVAVRSSRATYEIPFGAIERPTHRNTSWDAARYEVSGHRWADLSEGDYGVALMNDSKYGWDIEGDRMRLTLLRSPESPDPEADRGVHEFTYALLPHRGDWRERVVNAAYELNAPLLARTVTPHAGRLPRVRSTISVDRPSVIVETVKMAEDGRGLIVRVYEARGCRGPVQLTFTRAVAEAEECNLLEEPIGPVDAAGFHIAFDILPWQIRTFRIIPGESVTASAGIKSA
ncbi:MAG: alpha-mannosidase [Chthonomonadales bacterium]|nr:alpha-mannosidase [Chthonomonadales bacterium]